MSNIKERPVKFEEPVTVIKPKRPRLHRVSLVWEGPGTLMKSGRVMVDEAYAEAVSKYFGKSFKQACNAVKDSHRYGIVALMDTTAEVAEAKASKANEYAQNNLQPPFLPAMHFTHERI